MTSFWWQLLPRCPMCQKRAFDIERISNDIVIMTCGQCEAKFRVDMANEGSITVLNIGKDPRNTGAKLEELSTKTTPQFWRDFDKVENAEKPLACDRCGTILTQLPPIEFRTGATSREREIFYRILIGDPTGYHYADRTSMEMLTLDPYICKKCRRVEFYMPQRRRQ